MKQGNKTVILSNLLLTNVGCEIILRGTIAFITKVFPNENIKFYFPSYQVDYDKVLMSDLANVEVIPMLESKKYIRGIARKLGIFNKFWTPRFDSKYFKKADIFISVGGDIYTMFGNCLPEDWIGHEQYATKHNIPSLMFGANMERFEILSKDKRTLLLEHLSRFEMLLVRDENTKKYLNKHNIDNNVVMFPDPIFSLREMTYFKRSLIKSIAINFTPILLRDYGDNIAVLYANLVSDLIRFGYKVTLLPHVTSLDKNPKLDDNKAIEVLLSKLSEDDKNKVEVFKEKISYSSISNKIDEVDLFIGARMHGCLNSLTLGKAVIFLAYSSKAFTMVETLKEFTPFSKVSDSYIAIKANEVNADFVTKFIEERDRWALNSKDPIIIDTQSYLNELSAWDILSNRA